MATEIPAAPTTLPAVREARRLNLEWPETIRAGDSDVLKLTLEVESGGGLQATAEFSGHETRGETVEIPDLYDTHRVFAEARLEMAGMEVAPNDLSSQPLERGQKITFYWSVRPAEVGDYRGVIWFYLRFVPLDGSLETQRPISILPIEIRAVD
jgi:hypothetical protein